MNQMPVHLRDPLLTLLIPIEENDRQHQHQAQRADPQNNQDRQQPLPAEHVDASGHRSENNTVIEMINALAANEIAAVTIALRNERSSSAS